MQEPLVSIVCITYNHEPYLRKALEGFLMQETTFPVEIVLAEDCSTDGTRLICEEYAAKYPERINYIWSETNVGAVANERRAMKAARGMYIAFCEGDDYWTVPDKLQRQVDFLESHPNYSVTFHRCHHVDVATGERKEDYCARFFTDDREGVDVSIPMFFASWITQPLTMVYRASCLDLDDMQKYAYYRDMHQIYHLLTNGKGFLFAFFGGNRLVHKGGMMSKASSYRGSEVALAIADELYKFNRNSYTKDYLILMLQWHLQECVSSGMHKNRIKTNIRLFALSGNVKRLLKATFPGVIFEKKK